MAGRLAQRQAIADLEFGLIRLELSAAGHRRSSILDNCAYALICGHML
jgi:hypothetical protein